MNYILKSNLTILLNKKTPKDTLKQISSYVLDHPNVEKIHSITLEDNVIHMYIGFIFDIRKFDSYNECNCYEKYKDWQVDEMFDQDKADIMCALSEMIHKRFNI